MEKKVPDCLSYHGCDRLFIDIIAVYGLLRQADTLAIRVAGETRTQKASRIRRLRLVKKRITEMVPMFQVVWYGRYRLHGLVIREGWFQEKGEKSQ